MGLLGAPEGLKALNQAHPDVDVYLACLDEKLNDKNYIYPGLGDAGDRILERNKTQRFCNYVIMKII